ncbi:MAG: hypothetical protein K8R75_04465 [Deltaproteobacteria bacterium]|nr:hypothetical protein [Deltaproteobacteria bacterium]
MRGGGYADILPVLQVPDNKADAVPCERLQYINVGGNNAFSDGIVAGIEEERKGVPRSRPEC